ncbi:transcription factor [Grosmannia clavigera kw1407]|uniref:Transcription factor n=1 Tax=Grosmannia clavigera (strain kw1407 / UAMH 11150) TaxID=655863 RepID=F0XKX0_GROCL|nr:transcription factor [Grosmannia clavigera kw1407]EFX01822.1 transcription factor [Grosmannia clavigera kw1407]
MAEGHHHNLHLHSHHHDAGDSDEDNGEQVPNSEGVHNPYASANRWRHQESPAFARHAAAPRDDEDPRGNTSDLRDFLNASRVTPTDTAAGAAGVASSASSYRNRSDSAAGGGKFTPIVVPTAAADVESRSGSAGQSAAGGSNEIVVGPLLNYRRTEGDNWIGSVLVVTRGGGKTLPATSPTLVFGPADGTGEATAEAGGQKEMRGICLYSDPRATFWRFNLSVRLRATETRWQYSLPGLQFASATKPKTSVFSVPAASESMRILFFSCNGFSVGTDEEAWSGPALWNDVLRHHSKAAFHVMIGGGDQIYNDGIRVNGPLHEWTAIGNPKKRREFLFPESLRKKCDDYYLNNYIRWYSTEPFATANGQIAQLNIWDDHDIIDGFGSYVNEFMKCDVFRGIGGSAHKYYMLFQHHLPPPPSTFTSDAPHVGVPQANGHAEDPAQLVDTYVAPAMIESGYIIGSKPGPYVAEHSHNMYAKLGARMAFLGIDARTERTRHQVNYPETYDQIFDRVDKEFKAAAAAGEPVRHLILLLGIPIAYPRLTWLENVFNSPVMGPMKFMNRRFGFGGGFFNYFDGSVDLLDDLDDHYTARTHKKERSGFVERLQTVSAAHSVRITILGGDVHLAALGRFYSNPSLRVAAEQDHRFMINVVSSAITNKPPPAAIANLLARRNKIHHLNEATDETLFRLFDKDPGTATRTASHNQVTMPSRNFAIITENSPHNEGVAEAETANSNWVPGGRGSSPSTMPANGTNATNATNATNGDNSSVPPGSSAGYSASATSTRSRPATRSASGRHGNGHRPLHAGEEGAGTKHRAAGPLHGRLNDGSLDVSIRVEMDQHDREGHTEAYGLSIPALDCTVPPVPAIPSRFRDGSGQ